MAEIGQCHFTSRDERLCVLFLILCHSPVASHFFFTPSWPGACASVTSRATCGEYAKKMDEVRLCAHKWNAGGECVRQKKEGGPLYEEAAMEVRLG